MLSRRKVSFIRENDPKGEAWKKLAWGRGGRVREAAAFILKKENF